MPKTSLLVYSAIALLLAACQTMAPRSTATLTHIDATLKKESTSAANTAAVTPPPAVSEALLPPLRVDMSGGGAPVEQRFDITVNHAQAREFFMSLVEGTPYNMVVHPDVSGEISLTLKNVTIDDVMKTVRDVYGYEYKRTSGGYQVMPIRMQSRVFEVNYLDVKRTSKSETRVNSGQVTDSGNNDNNNNTNNGNTGSTSGGTTTPQPSTQMTTESESSFWDGLKAQLQTLIGKGDGRSVVVSPQAGIVVVRALPSELRDVASFLSASQANLQRQVVLEAKIIEVSLGDGFQSGINWAALGQVGNGKTAIFGQTGGGTIFSNGTSEIAGSTGTLNPGNYNPIDGGQTSAFGGVFTAALNLNDFNAFIELLKSQGDVQVLSSPRVSTVNNQPAVIKVGSDEFFVTNVSTNTTAIGTTGTTNRNVTLTPFFSGIALDVTPQISDRGDVILHIHPTVSEVKDQTKSFKIDNQDQSLPLAFSTVRESDSIVRAGNGQVIVLGGLMQDQNKLDRAGVPILGDLPGVGAMFRHTKSATTKSELVILLRPVVIQTGSEWGEQIRQSSQRVDRMSMKPSSSAKPVAIAP